MFKDAKLDKETPVPLYYQLKTLLLEHIKNGEFGSGEMIPTEKDLMDMFDISRTTVRQAITELVREGYLYRIKSKGTFVSKPKLSLRVGERQFTLNGSLKESGQNAQTIILKLEIVPMPQSMVEVGGGKPGDKAIYLYRKRFLDGEPFMRVVTYLPFNKFSFLLDADLERESLTDLMEQRPETSVYRRIRRIEAIPADQEDIDILGVKRGDAIQKMSVSRYNEAGALLDMSYAYYRGDMNAFEIDVIRTDVN